MTQDGAIRTCPHVLVPAWGQDPSSSVARQPGLCPGLLHTSVAYSDEYIGVFLARGLHQDEQAPDEGEFVDVVRKPLSELVEMVMRGELPDPKTQLAILKAARLLGV